MKEFLDETETDIGLVNDLNHRLIEINQLYVNLNSSSHDPKRGRSDRKMSMI